MVRVLLFSVLIGLACSLSPLEIKTCVHVHNALRGLHKNTYDLVWDASLAAEAELNAKKLIQLGKLEHDPRKTNNENWGENLYWSRSGRAGKCVDASISWYKEIKDYDFSTARSKNRKPVGHFTQLVWKDTKRFGVGIATRRVSKSISTYIVALYSPLGNNHYVGQRFKDYSSNVQQLINPSAPFPRPIDLDPSLCANANKQCGMYPTSFCAKFQQYMEANCYKKCNSC